MAGATVPETDVSVEHGYAWGSVHWESDGTWAGGALEDADGVLGCWDEVAGEAVILGGWGSWGPSDSPTQPRPNLMPGGRAFSIRFVTISHAVGLSFAANRARLRE
jgi:hypothetical protein